MSNFILAMSMVLFVAMMILLFVFSIIYCVDKNFKFIKPPTRDGSSGHE